MTMSFNEASRRRILFAFTVDVERDIPHRVGSTEGINYITDLLDMLTKSGIIGTFFFTGDIVRDFPEIVCQVQTQGHEIGCHGWEHETYGKHSPYGLSLPVLSKDHKREMITRATDLIAEVCATRPHSFRAPYLSFSYETLQVLSDLGYTIDSSLWSGIDDKAQLRPHSIALSAVKTILEIPVPAGSIIHNKPPYLTSAGVCSFTLRIAGQEQLRQATNRVIGLQRNEEQTAVVVFSCHPWEFVPRPPWQGLLPPHFWLRTDNLFSELSSYLEFIQQEYLPVFVPVRTILDQFSKLDKRVDRSEGDS